MKLTIDRATWLQGEGSSRSYLLRKEDGKKCCLGFFALTCGASESEIQNKMLIRFTKLHFTKLQRDQNDRYDPDYILEMPKNAEFDMPSTDDIYGLVTANDRVVTSNIKREENIKERFARFGVQVTFIGKYPVVDRGI